MKCQSTTCGVIGAFSVTLSFDFAEEDLLLGYGMALFYSKLNLIDRMT